MEEIYIDKAVRRKATFLKRQRAALENCKKSTGPKDCVRARFNSLEHGLRANMPVIPGEDPQELERLRESVYEKLKPVNDIEVQLAEQVVFGFWRLQRGSRAEHAILEDYGNLERTQWDKILDMDYLDKIAKFENHAANQLDRALVALARLRELNYLEPIKDVQNVAQRKNR